MSANRTGRRLVTTVSAARESDMTLEERKGAVAYAAMLVVMDGLRRILRTGADDLLSPEGRRNFAVASDALDKVNKELSQFMRQHTDYGSEEGKTNDAH